MPASTPRVSSGGDHSRAIAIEVLEILQFGERPGSLLDSLVQRAGPNERQLTRRGGVAVSFPADGSRMTYIGVAPGYVRLMGPDLDEASSRPVHAPPTPGTGGVRVLSGNISRDGATYIAKGEDAVGPGFWGIPIGGGAPRLLVRLDDPRRTAPRAEFATDGRRIFFTLTERDADVWAVRLDDR